MLPYLVALFAVSSYALLGPIAKKLGTSLPPFAFIASSSLLVFLFSAAISLLTERAVLFETFRRIEWKWLLLFSAINIIGYVGYLWSISRIPVVHYEMFTVICPILAGLFATYLLGEAFHMRYLVGLVFVSIGLFIAIKPI